MPSSDAMSAVEIADDLERQIHKGEYKPGDRLPSYSRLALQYDSGITKISAAIALLRDRGVVVGRPGVGVFVARD